MLRSWWACRRVWFAACCFVWLAGAVAAQVPEAGPALREVPAVAAALSRGNPVPAWTATPSQIPHETTADALVMHFADTHFHAGSEPVAFVHRVMQANQAAALAELGQYSIPFHPEYQRVELHLLRILRGGQSIDKLRTADIRFLQREQELELGIYTGVVSALVVIDDLRTGDVVELAYSIIGQNPVFGGKFVDAASWDAAVPVRWRRVTLDAPEDRAIRYRMIGAGARGSAEAVEMRSGGRRIVRFETRNLPSVDQEAYVPRGVQPLRWIQFSEFGSWREVARWATELFGAGTAAAELQTALAPARGARDPSDAVMKALAFVQNDVRYLSVAFGENSHRPYPPAQVIARRYGDCKDKSLLLVAMLRQLGIESAPALASLQHKDGLDGMLPSPLAFDHVIVRAMVGGRARYLDATVLGQGARLDRLGEVHQGAQVLVVSPDTAALTTVPQLADDPTRIARVERATVTQLDAPASMKVHLLYTGLDAEALRRNVARLTPQQLRKAYEGNLDRRYPGAVLTAEPALVDDRDENSISVELEYRISNFMEAARDNWVARYQADNLRHLFFIPDNAQRRQPLAVPSYPSLNRYDFEVTLPEEYDARRRPEERTLKARVFTLSESLSFSGRVARASLELRVNTDRVEPPNLVEFFADLRKADEMVSGAFVVSRSDLKAVAAPQVPFKQAVTERLEKIVKATGAVIANSQLSGGNSGDVLCERGRALAYLGRGAEALADIQAATQQQPASATTLRCSGEIHFVLGNFSRSAPDFSRALALGARDAETYFQRGLAYYYSGRLDEAADDFASSGAAADDAAARVRAEIWRTLALRQARAGGAPAGTAAAGQSRNDWPVPALGLVRNLRLPEDVLREAHRETGERLETALAEAYLYIGQYFLLAGDAIKAGVYFRRALDKGALHAFYHASARHELARLPQGVR